MQNRKPNTKCCYKNLHNEKFEHLIYYSNLLKKSKKHHFNRLNLKNVIENKRFCKTVKPFVTDRSKTTKSIISIESEQTLREDKNIWKILNEWFSNVTKSLKLWKSNKFLLKMRKADEHYGCEKFSFNLLSEDDIIKAVNKRPSRKSIIL